MNLDFKRIYYYIICLITFFVIMWGAIDMVSATISFAMVNKQELALPSSGDIPFDQYYQYKMSLDRITDSCARIIISAIFFGYAKWRLNKMEAA